MVAICHLMLSKWLVNYINARLKLRISVIKRICQAKQTGWCDATYATISDRRDVSSVFSMGDHRIDRVRSKWENTLTRYVFAGFLATTRRYTYLPGYSEQIIGNGSFLPTDIILMDISMEVIKGFFTLEGKGENGWTVVNDIFNTTDYRSNTNQSLVILVWLINKQNW